MIRTTQREWQSQKSRRHTSCHCSTKEISNELPYLTPRMLDRLSTVDEELVHNKLQRLNVRKSCGPDDLQPRLIKELNSVLCKPLKLKLYDTCIDNSRIPCLERGKHYTHFQKREKSNAKTYWPIILTCITYNVVESIIRNAIIDLMYTRNLFQQTSVCAPDRTINNTSAVTYPG